MSSASGVKGVLQVVAAGQTFSPDAMAAAVDVLTAEDDADNGVLVPLAAFLKRNAQ